ncbi:MAG: type II toxin-antitoxin system RelE/ParE family toxin [Bacteroidia bacterium]|jgi:proteic killer suppression protein
MVVYFGTSELQELYETPLDEIRGKRKIPTEVIKQYKKKVQLLLAINKLEQLRPFKGLNFEFLKGDRKGQCSIRLNDQYRLLITPMDEGTVQVVLVNEISKHYE